ncbi:5' exonuclease Apollo [Ataeniobius toweri]|uniref:5' exonuclease Apollo n=1 Tax=Ataeniobius toweri TaxID=208326 RepID=A0ABU7AKY9_9TELE|nr:5' exonuclease Apollo [Ataeniobius toweri]
MSANGKVIPHTPLAVDFWHVRKCPGSRLFFLTHMHSDHTAGLTSTWSDRPIYCSPITAALLRLKLQVKERWIHPLELCEPYLLPLDDIGKEKLTVTLIDANHCPGAVMFLFEGYFGDILYTGDFRYTPSMLREPCLRTNTTIDVLFLDNTNCDPNRTLPSRQKATQQIKEIIRSHPDHNVVIGLYALGKETLLVELAMEFKTWVEVSFERMETLKVLELPDVFTTEQGAGRIRAVEQSRICSAALHEWNKEHPTLAILPTSRPLISFHPNVYVVPYSDHSSYQELEDFVSALKPSSLVPIVGSCLPGGLSALLPHKKRHEIIVPESVQQYMSRQPEQQLSSLAYAGLCRRNIRPFAPKGVIFDTPVKECRNLYEEACEAESIEQDGSVEDTDTESSERDSDCILVDPSIKLSPNKDRQGDNAQIVSEELLMMESVQLGQVNEQNFGPVGILGNSKTCLKPIRTRQQFKIKARISTHGHEGRGDVQISQTLSDQDAMSEHSWEDRNNTSALFQNSPDRASLASYSSSAELSRVNVEKHESNLLKCLPFSKEDFMPRGFLPHGFVRKFALSPVKDSEVDDI